MSRIDLANPHGFLGAHPANGGVVVRAYRPDAERVTVQPHAIELHETDDGVWEGMVEDATLPLAYELEVAYANGNTFTIRDPYAFLPTIGDLDLHLAGEGRHEELYERLGAHVREVDGVTGTSFAVWAPSARSVSVVGDFNSWDGRLHPMRTLGSSGIWELFVPGVDSGARYKYELRTQDGSLRLKADPVAFATELPPANASVVWRSQHRWRDDEWVAARRTSEPLAQPVGDDITDDLQGNQLGGLQRARLAVAPPAKSARRFVRLLRLILTGCQLMPPHRLGHSRH